MKTNRMNTLANYRVWSSNPQQKSESSKDPAWLNHRKIVNQNSIRIIHLSPDTSSTLSKTKADNVDVQGKRGQYPILIAGK